MESVCDWLEHPAIASAVTAIALPGPARPHHVSICFGGHVSCAGRNGEELKTYLCFVVLQSDHGHSCGALVFDRVAAIHGA
jgi:hypothetical protein